MSKLKDHYRTLNVINEWDFANLNLFLSYTPEDYGRGSHGARWQVVKARESTDPTAPWYNYGKKTFNVFSYTTGDSHANAKQRALEAAKLWASAKYKIKEWARTPYGSWMESKFVKRRTAELGKPQ
jgi:hypothetical protein